MSLYHVIVTVIAGMFCAMTSSSSAPPDGSDRPEVIIEYVKSLSQRLSEK